MIKEAKYVSRETTWFLLFNKYKATSTILQISIIDCTLLFFNIVNYALALPSNYSSIIHNVFRLNLPDSYFSIPTFYVIAPHDISVWIDKFIF